eukprot:364505-Chlamydomonas_euryale.AAC.5
MPPFPPCLVCSGGLPELTHRVFGVRRARRSLRASAPLRRPRGRTGGRRSVDPATDDARSVRLAALGADVAAHACGDETG